MPDAKIIPVVIAALVIGLVSMILLSPESMQIPPTPAFKDIQIDGVWNNATVYNDVLSFITTGGGGASNVIFEGDSWLAVNDTGIGSSRLIIDGEEYFNVTSTTPFNFLKNLVITDDGSHAFILNRTDAGAGANLGTFQWRGQDKHQYASVVATSDAIGAGVENGTLSFRVSEEGTQSNYFNLDGNKAVIDSLRPLQLDDTASPAQNCNSDIRGALYYDTDNGIVFVCDSSNSRNKWLSVSEWTIHGEENNLCTAGQDAGSNNNCRLDWGDNLGGTTTGGLFLPYDSTIVGYGYSERAGGSNCGTGSFDLEVWQSTSGGSPSNVQDNNYAYVGDLASGINDDDVFSNSLNLDVDSSWINIGVDNNCSGDISDYIMTVTVRWRHD